MVTINLADDLSLQRPDQGPSTFDIRPADDAPRPITIDWPTEQDLACRAHALMQQHVQGTLPITMRLTKRIPSGAGLGGGSSDAAGMLIGLNQLFTLGLADEQLIQLGVQLGSDVGFMVAAQLGKRSAMVSGVGERIQPITLQQPLHLVLVLPNLHCATAEVYSCFDRINTSAQLDAARVRKLASTHPLNAEAPFNDLAEAACGVEPRLGELLGRIEEVIGWPVHVSGSGAAMFVLVGSHQDAATLAQVITDECGVTAIAVTTSA